MLMVRLLPRKELELISPLPPAEVTERLTERFRNRVIVYGTVEGSNFSMEYSAPWPTLQPNVPSTRGMILPSAEGSLIKTVTEFGLCAKLCLLGAIAIACTLSYLFCTASVLDMGQTTATEASAKISPGLIISPAIFLFLFASTWWLYASALRSTQLFLCSVLEAHER